MPTLMIQGCTSDAGKSTIVTAICRILANAGLAVAPFKPQNMALNSAVTADGGEIGRAQAVQAEAARIPPHTDHNPVLLKPTSDCVAQVIIHGRSIGNLNALDYHAYKQTAKSAVMASWARLSQQYQWVIVEGAGSPAEVNLREGDIANMGFAEAVDCPVWLVADIDRGGVFAHFVGTLACLSEQEQARVQGFIINRFRGDIALLEPGIEWLEQKTGKPVLAVVPYLHGLKIAAEDAISTPQSRRGDFHIAVLTLPHIANHTDFDPLLHYPGVSLTFSTPGKPLPNADLVIIPGSKNTRADLAWLRAHGYEQQLARHLRFGGKVMGICGGYQMLGALIADPHGIEGEPGQTTGLGWLPVTTVLQPEKMLQNLQGELTLEGQTVPVCGYEIHQGATQALSPVTAPIRYSALSEGALSADNLLFGTYLHGIFDSPAACALILAWAGCQAEGASDWASQQETAIEELSSALSDAIGSRLSTSLPQYLTEQFN